MASGNAPLVVTVMLAAAMLSGCAHASAGASQSPGSSSSRNSDATRTTAYLQVMHERFPDNTLADDKLIDVARRMCDAFDAEPTVETWVRQVKMLTDAGFSGKDAGFLIGASVTTFCPERNDVLPS